MSTTQGWCCRLGVRQQQRSCVDRARVWLEGLESSSSAVVCFGAAPDDPTQTTSSEQTHERERIAL